MATLKTKKAASAQGPSRVRQYHHGDLPRALASAARELLEANGLSQVTIRSACERVGVSIAAPYRHFGSREELVAAALVEAFEELEGATRRAWRREPDPAEGLVAVGVAYVGFAHKHPNTYRAMFGGALERQSHAALREAGLRALAVLQEAVRTWLTHSARSGNAAAASDEATITLIAWSMAHGISTLALDNVLDVQLESAKDQAARLFRTVVGAMQR